MVLFFVAVLPIFLIGRYIYRKDSEKESIGLLFKLFVSGIGSLFLTLIFSFVCGIFFPSIFADEGSFDLISLFFHVFFGIALIEEFSKWIFVYKIGYNNKEFDQVYDIIVYSVFVALGFAFIENIVYVFEAGFTIGILRGIFTVPGHACDGFFMGYYLSFAKLYGMQGDSFKSKHYLRLSLLVPILLHGFYDYCLFSRNIILILLFIIFIITLYVITLKRIKKISLSNRKLRYNYNFCPNCGSRVDNDICGVCGGHNE